jgi:hypothetical protein
VPGKGTTIRAGISLAKARPGKAGQLPVIAQFICCQTACPKRLVKIPLLKSAGIKLESP